MRKMQVAFPASQTYAGFATIEGGPGQRRKLLDAHAFPRVCWRLSRLWNHFNLLKFHLRKKRKDLWCKTSTSTSALASRRKSKPEDSKTALLLSNTASLPPYLLLLSSPLSSFSALGPQPHRGHAAEDGVSSAAGT